MSPNGKKETFVHIAYLDDSGSDKPSPIAVVGAVLVSPDIEFPKIASSVGFVVQDLIPKEKLDEFEEFKACDLYHGNEVFKGIDQPIRFKAIENLLITVRNFKLPVIYSAVDKSRLAKMAVGGADPIDVAFRMCARGIEQWMSVNDEHGLGLFIMDDTKDKELKNALTKSFQLLRSPLRPPHWAGDLYHIHDDMYFGDSLFDGYPVVRSLRIFHFSPSEIQS